MISVRGTLAAIAFGGIVAAGSMPSAHADAADDYLMELHNAGLGIINAAQAVTSGYQLCALLPSENGEHLVQRLVRSGYFQTVAQGRTQVTAAAHHLCPDQDHTRTQTTRPDQRPFSGGIKVGGAIL